MKEKENDMFLCSGCSCVVKKKSLVRFKAFGLTFRVCKSCAKEALNNIKDALDETESVLKEKK